MLSGSATFFTYDVMMVFDVNAEFVVVSLTITSPNFMIHIRHRLRRHIEN